MKLTDTKKLEMISIMENMSINGSHEDALKLHATLDIDYVTYLDTSKPFSKDGETHQVVEQMKNGKTKSLGHIFLQYKNNEQDSYDTDSNLMGADWNSEQDYGVPK